MRKIIATVAALSVLLAGCAHVPRVDPKYESFGIFNEAQYKSDKVCYKVDPLTIVLAVLFIETIVITIYIVGFDLWDPVRMKKSPDDKCGVDD